jgi:hypothetical protein
MKTICALLAAVVLIGCAVTSEKDRVAFRSIIDMCDLTSVGIGYGDCVKNGLDAKVPMWVNDEHAEYIKAYIEWTNAAGARVDKGEMTADQARHGAKDLINRLTLQARQEGYDRQARHEANMAAFFAGLAVYGAAQPTYQYQQPNTTIYTTPGAMPITCTTMGNVVNCM